MPALVVGARRRGATRENDALSLAILVALLIAFPVVGVIFRRWLVLLLPLLVLPVFYVGLDEEWWGSETGDGWEYAAVAVTTFGVVTTALAVIAARRARPRPELPE